MVAGLLPVGDPVSVHDVGIPRISRQRPGLPAARSMTALAFLDLSHQPLLSVGSSSPATTAR